MIGAEILGMRVYPQGQMGRGIREIKQTDIELIIDLLARGFPKPRRYWEVGLARLRVRSVPAGTPRYGYMLEANGRPVGTIFVISSLRRSGGRLVLFSNLAIWYVEPAFRSHAMLLFSRALANEQTTYLNVSASTHIHPIIEAFGFKRYSEGQVLGLPALACNRQGGRVRVVDANSFGEWDLEEVSANCSRRRQATAASSSVARCQARIRPFAFVPRLVRGIIPALNWPTAAKSQILLTSPVPLDVISCGLVDRSC